MHFLSPQKGELLHKLHYKPDVKNKGHALTARVYITILAEFSFEHVASLAHQLSAFFYISRSGLLEKAGFARDNHPRYLPSCVRYIYSP